MTIRPRRIRRMAFVAAPLVAIFFAVLAALLSGPTGQQGTAVFQTSDRLAMSVLGLIAGAAILIVARPKVTADSTTIKVQNIIGGYELPWSVVRAVRFDRRSPCLTLELEDDDVVFVMAVQAADKQYAVESARALRALHAAARASSPS
jgi:Bacterial PH domain